MRGAVPASPGAKDPGLNLITPLKGAETAGRGEVRVPKWRLFYHIVWATKGREPLIDDAREAVIRLSIQTTCRGEKVILHAIGMMPDHVHVAASVPPGIALATLIGRLKGASAHAANAANVARTVPFAWQSEYGVFSFTEKNLPDVVAYVTNQRQRHAARDLWPTFEDLENP
jgi:putative transposase